MRNQTRDRSNQPRGQYSAKIFLLFALILIACAFVGVAYAAGFSDDFNDGVQDTTWRQQGVFRGSSTQFESRVTVAEQNGQLIITPLSNALDNHYNGYVSVATWDMTGARASVEVQHRFWRFRHDQVTDSIVFETSTDGTAWTARQTIEKSPLQPCESNKF